MKAMLTRSPKGMLAVGQGLGGFDHGQALPGQGRFIHRQVGGLHQPAVGGHVAPRAQHQKISQDDIGRGDLLHVALPDDQGRGPHQGLQGADGLFGFAFGLVADEGVEGDHAHDQHGIQNAPGEDGNSGGRPQQGHRQRFELLGEDFPAGPALRLRQHIGAVLLEIFLQPPGPVGLSSGRS